MRDHFLRHPGHGCSERSAEQSACTAHTYPVDFSRLRGVQNPATLGYLNQMLRGSPTETGNSSFALTGETASPDAVSPVAVFVILMKTINHRLSIHWGEVRGRSRMLIARYARGYYEAPGKTTSIMRKCPTLVSSMAFKLLERETADRDLTIRCTPGRATFGNNDFRGGLVNVDVITLRSHTPCLFSS